VKIWQIILATLVIFGTGVVTGGLLVDYSSRGQHRLWRGEKREAPRTPVGNPSRELKAFPQNLQILPHAGLRTNFVERLDRELKLTPEQHHRIEKIIIDSQERTKELWKELGQPFREEIQQSRERIRAALTPEQREKFEEIMQRSPHPRRPDEDVPSNDRRAREPRRSLPTKTPSESPEPKP
jgi:hypothetical protein